MGKRRHLSRRTALQILYAQAYRQGPTEQVASDVWGQELGMSRKNWTPFARALADAVIQHSQDLDAEIEPALEHWRLERLTRLDHLTLRMALAEMRHFDDIPLRVTINEYIELAKEFGTDESARFVNGILDRLARNYAHKDRDTPHDAQ